MGDRSVRAGLGAVGLCFLLGLLALAAATANADEATGGGQLRQAIEEIGANVVFIRHAHAPGFGDPDNFDINSCATQRNLDDFGRKQAAQIGRHIKDAGIEFSKILSSQWCRCKETAEYLDLGPWQEFAGLNSFFSGLVDRDKTLRLLYAKLEHLRPYPDGLVLLVTHQVVIDAVTGISPPSGGVVVYNSVSGQRQALNLVD